MHTQPWSLSSPLPNALGRGRGRGTSMIVRLEPVDGVQITTLMDNYSDALLPSEGPAKRAFGIDAPAPRIAVETFEGGESRDSLMAEHGFSALVAVSKNGRSHTILFDTGVSPN